MQCTCMYYILSFILTLILMVTSLSLSLDLLPLDIQCRLVLL